MKRSDISRFADIFDFTVAGKWLFLGVLVGIVSGVGAIVLQFGLQAIRELCLIALTGLTLDNPGGEPADPGVTVGTFTPYLVILIPALGGLLSGLLVFWLAPEAEGHGTDAAINAYHWKLGRIRWRVPIVKLVTSAITIGTGGSGGREGPIAQIGAGFGSFLGTRLGLSSRDRRLLLAAGIGGGVGAIFRAPLAGAIFAAEVLYSSSEVEAEVLLPAMVSSIVGYAVYASRFGWDHMFSGAGLHGFSNPLELGPYLVLALVVSGAALLYIRSFYGIRGVFARSTLPQSVRPMLGGALTGLFALCLLWVFNYDRSVGDVLSSGYGIIQRVIDTDGLGVPILVLFAVGFGKILTTALSIGSGGSGGVFGPSMVIGASLGAAVGVFFHNLIPDVVAHPMTFAMVGMAGFFTAAAKTPISTVIMVSELTGNYELLLPSMWVCAFAFLLTHGRTIYRSQIPSRALTLPQLGAVSTDRINHLAVADVFHRTRRFVRISRHHKLPEIMTLTENSRQRIFPVVDDDGVLLGSFRIGQFFHALQEEGADIRTADDLVDDRAVFVRETDTIEHALRILRNNDHEEILVVRGDGSRQVLGILTTADILLVYHRSIASVTAIRTDRPVRASATDDRTPPPPS